MAAAASSGAKASCADAAPQHSRPSKLLPAAVAPAACNNNGIGGGASAVLQFIGWCTLYPLLFLYAEKCVGEFPSPSLLPSRAG